MSGALKTRSFPDWICGLSSCGGLKTRKCSGMDSWIVPACGLKIKEVFRVGLDFIVSVLLSASFERVGVSRMPGQARGV